MPSLPRRVSVRSSSVGIGKRLVVCEVCDFKEVAEMLERDKWPATQSNVVYLVSAGFNAFEKYAIGCH